MTAKEILALVQAGYTKAEIAAMDTPAPTAAPAAPVQAPAKPTASAAPAVQGIPAQPMNPGDTPPVTLADVLDAVNALRNYAQTPAPAFGEPAPRGISDMVAGYLGVSKGGVNNG